MNQYVARLENDFSLIEHGFKEEEKRALLIISPTMMNISRN